MSPKNVATNDIPPVQDTALTNLDYLSDALALEEEFGNNDKFASPDAENTRVNLRRIVLPQRNSQKYDGLGGKIVIEPYKDQVDEEGKPVEVQEVDSIDFLLVDSHTFETMGRGAQQRMLTDGYDWLLDEARQAGTNFPIGGRLMWAFNNDGSRKNDEKNPTCASPNGIEPRSSFVGKDVFDFRTGRTEKIGYRLDPVSGQYFEAQHKCLGCPFSLWLKDDQVLKGKSGAATCRQSFTYVVYDIDRKELLLISGVNLGVQMALVGTTYAKTGHLFNGDVLRGIKYPFSYTGNEGGVVRFLNRPEGKPTAQNPDAPVYAVRMTVSTNSFSPNSTIIPVFTLLDGKTPTAPPYNDKTRGKAIATDERKLTREEYADYLQKASGVYMKDNYRGSLMRLDTIEHRNEFVPTAYEKKQLEGVNAPALPEPTIAVGDGGVDFDNPFA